MSTMRNDPRLVADDAQAGIIHRFRGWMARTDLGSPVKYMITGAVLLAAVTIDALVRRQRESTGR
jgi:D-xylose transport system permease protein